MRPPTILTNLQRGNVKQESPLLFKQRTLHELAAQGELYSLEEHLVETQDSNCMTPILWAAGYGQNLTVELLLNLGANPNHRSTGGKTALMLAASRGFLHVVKSLIRGGADVNLVDETGNSALMYAALQDYPLIIQELLKNNANLGLVNELGQTAYTIALIKQNKMAQATIESHLVNLPGQNKNVQWL